MRFMLKINKHHFIIDIILSIIIFLTFTGIIIQLWFVQFDVDINGLQSKRYLAKPLLEILTHESTNKRYPSNWIDTIISEKGKTIYPYGNIEDNLKDLMEPRAKDFLANYLSLMVTATPEDMSIVNFTYNGEKYLCLYKDSDLPYIIKILKTPLNLIRIFIGIILFLSIGSFHNYRLKKNLLLLSQAINRTKELDFDTPLTIDHKNEISDVLNAFEDMRKKLKMKKDQSILIMMSITHDLKTPLTSIRGYLEAIKDGMLDTVEDVMITIDKMLKKTNLLEERIDEMLEFSRTIDCINSKGSFYIQPWLDEIKEYLYEESTLKSTNYSVVDNYTGNFSIAGDSKKITRSIINLYDNACRYIAKNDPVKFSISLNSKETMLILTMDDGGPGVLPEDREKIFDLFFRKDKGRNTRGMGIGLASVKFIAELHGGSVVCNESDLGGASFKVSLPIKIH